MWLVHVVSPCAQLKWETYTGSTMTKKGKLQIREWSAIWAFLHEAQVLTIGVKSDGNNNMSQTLRLDRQGWGNGRHG